MRRWIYSPLVPREGSMPEVRKETTLPKTSHSNPQYSAGMVDRYPLSFFPYRLSWGFLCCLGWYVKELGVIVCASPARRHRLTDWVWWWDCFFRLQPTYEYRGRVFRSPIAHNFIRFLVQPLWVM